MKYEVWTVKVLQFKKVVYYENTNACYIMKIRKIIIPDYLHHKVTLKIQKNWFFFLFTDFWKIKNVTCARKFQKSE